MREHNAKALEELMMLIAGIAIQSSKLPAFLNSGYIMVQGF